jgi:hypothetical protein
LADKTLPVVVLEKLWKDGVGKFDAIVHIEHISLLGPGNKMLDRMIFYHSR